MAIETGVVAKSLLGLGILGAGATTVYFGGDYLSNSLSKYDRALIDFLRDDKGNDIVFTVKKITGDSGGESELDASNDVSFSGTSTQSPIKVKVKVTTGSDSSFKKGSSTNPASQIEEIKKLGRDESSGWE